jgi:hypothetical protein
MPMLGCFRTKFTDNECVELYINKLFRLTSEETQRLAYSYRDILVIQENKHTLAHQAMLSVLQIRNIMSRVSRIACDKIVVPCMCADEARHEDARGIEAKEHSTYSQDTHTLKKPVFSS